MATKHTFISAILPGLFVRSLGLHSSNLEQSCPNIFVCRLYERIRSNLLEHQWLLSYTVERRRWRTGLGHVESKSNQSR